MGEGKMPSNRDQFRDRERAPIPYMGGTTVSCGEHPTAHKRHRWIRYADPGCGHSYCAHCGLVKEFNV